MAVGQPPGNFAIIPAGLKKVLTPFGNRTLGFLGNQVVYPGSYPAMGTECKLCLMLEDHYFRIVMFLQNRMPGCPAQYLLPLLP